MIRAFRHAPSGVAGMVAIVLIIVVSIVAPVVFWPAATTIDPFGANLNPGGGHLLGTDQLGRDILARILVATRLSIALAFVATALAAVVGGCLGMGATLLPPRIRSIALRTIDGLLAFPPILVAIFVGATIGPGIAGATTGVGIAISFHFARVASSLSLSISGREYINAARMMGVRGPRLLLRYVLPNVAEPLIVVTSASISSSIIFVSSLSFLGLGIQSPEFDWGRMLTEGVHAFYVTPVAAIAPAVAILLTALSFGFTGEAMARATNPVLWNAERPRERAKASPAAELKASDEASDGHERADGVLAVQDVTVKFPGPAGYLDVVSDISFTVGKGQMVGIVGESGSGKTITAMAIAQLVPYPGIIIGTVKLDGKDLKRLSTTDLDRLLGTDLAVVFQDPMSSLNPALRIRTQMTEASEVHVHLNPQDAVQLAKARLREVLMPAPNSQLPRYPHEFSGGMRQRIMIAMGLMNDPDVIIADEPTTALDVTIQAQIMDLFAKIRAKHRTAIVLISHNLGLVSQHCQRILVMYAGRIVEDLSVEQLLDEPLHPYTRALVGVVPDMKSSLDAPLQSIPGQAPGPADRPSGCPFHPRCPLAVERCSVERPDLISRAGSHRVACWVANQDIT